MQKHALQARALWPSAAATPRATPNDGRGKRPACSAAESSPRPAKPGRSCHGGWRWSLRRFGRRRRRRFFGGRVGECGGRIDRERNREHRRIAQRFAVIGATLQLAERWIRIAKVSPHRDLSAPHAACSSSDTFDAPRCSPIEGIATEPPPHARFELRRIDAAPRPFQTHPVETHGLGRARLEGPRERKERSSTGTRSHRDRSTFTPGRECRARKHCSRAGCRRRSWRGEGGFAGCGSCRRRSRRPRARRC